MRYIKLLFASVILVSMSACVTDNQSDLDMMGYVKTINIVGPEEIAFEQIDGSAQTKATSVSNNGALVFNWAVGDTLGIFPNKGNQVEFPITAQEGSTSASFDGGGWALRNNASYAAYYPFSVWNYFRNNQAVILDYSGQVQNGNGSFDHLSAYDYLASAKTTPKNSTVTFQMDRQGSILYIDIVVPEPATITSLTISCNEAIFVEKAALDISGNNPVVTPIETKESLTLTFENTTTTEQNETVRAYMAVQPVDFSSKTVTATLVTDAGTYTAPVVSRVVNKGKAAFLRFSDSFTDGSTETTTPPNNEIWYTSTDGNIVVPYKPESINVGIISNTYEGGKGRIVFDGAVTTIGNNAFSAFNAKNLKSIVFPATLTSIGDGAFSYNSNLENIQLNEGLLTIGSSAFECDRALDSIYIPSSVTFVNGSAFMECTNLQKFSGNYATLEGRLLVINGSACGVAQKDLTQIELPQGITEISSSLFQWCYNLTSVTLPSTLQRIGSHAFYDCYRLKSVSPLPESLQEVEGGAFAGCSKLEGFTGKFATQDGRFLIVENHLAAFAPNGLKAADIPDGVETIDRQSMSDFSSLETVHIPSSVKSIALYAFSGCNNLNSITVDASSVPSGDYGMFNQTNDCPIYVPFSSVDAYKSARYWSSYAERIQAIPNAQPNNEIWYTSTDGNIVVPNNSNLFGATLLSNTYKDGKGVMSFDGPVTMVGDKSYPSSEYAPFNYCGNLYSISLPESVEMIGFCAFYGCSSLQTVKMPSHLVYLGNDPFEGTDIRTINIPETDDITVGNLVGGFCYNLEEITGPYASIDHRCLIIENSIRAFAPAGLDSYTIEEGITEIGHGAFWGCQKGPKLIVFPSTLKVISNQSFIQCSMETLVFPEGLERIGYAAFFACRSLISVTMPSTLSYLDSHIFNNCTSLRSFSGKYASADGRLLVVNGSVKAFAQSGLTEYTIPEGITYATDGFDSYANLPLLESLTLPSTLCTLALRGQAITTLTSLATTPPSVSSSDYLYLPKVEAIYVPAGSIDAYKTASCWSSYADRIQAIPSSAGGGNEGTSEEAWN